MYDLIVIGSGPAGTSAALQGVMQGFDTLLIDKAVFPRNKTCGGLVSYKAIKELNFLPLKLDAANKITKVSIYNSKFERVDSREYDLLGVTISRTKLDSALVNRAVDSGVDFIENCGLEDIYFREDGYEIITSQGKFSTKFVIGCDGVFSRAAKITGVRPGWKKYQLGFTYSQDFSLGKKGPVKNTVEFHFLPLFAGMGWCFPYKDHINIGVGFPAIFSKVKARKVFAKFVERIKDTHEIHEAKSRLKGAFLPVGGLNKRFGRSNVLLAGDAAGLVDPFSGEGIYWAVKSGKLAVNSVKEFLTQSKTKKGLEEIYSNKCREAFYVEFWFSLFYALFMGKKTFYFKLLKKFPDLVSCFPNIMRQNKPYHNVIPVTLSKLPKYFVTMKR